MPNPETLEVIPNWALTEFGQDDAALARALRREWGLDDRFVIGYSGNMGRGHEFETIMSAMCELRNVPDIVFLFIGDGAKREWLEQKVALEHLTNVIFKPYQPLDRLSAGLCVPDIHLITLLPAMEGLIVPSKYYGVVAVGRPVIFVGDTEGELACQVRDAGNGCSFAVGDGAGLAECIRNLRCDTQAYDRMCSSSRAQHESSCNRAHRLASWYEVLVR